MSPSRRAAKYKELGLKDKKLTERLSKLYTENTLPKTPCGDIDDKIFSGSEKKTVENLKKAVR
jgi:arsenate reductase